MSMQFSTLDFPLEVKSISDEGRISGHVATFGGPPDSYGDIIAPEAFAESLTKHRQRGTMPLMLLNHDGNSLPIGSWMEMATDGKGLWGEGQLAMDDPVGVRVHSGLKNRRLRGLSIGYETKKSSPVEGRPGMRLLEAVNLWEVSVVNFPANRRAKVETVKSMDAADWWALHDKLREFDLTNDNPPELKMIEGMFQAETCPKSLRPFFAKRLVSGRSESDRPPHRGEPEGPKAIDPAEFMRALRATQPG